MKVSENYFNVIKLLKIAFLRNGKFLTDYTALQTRKQESFCVIVFITNQVSWKWEFCWTDENYEVSMGTKWKTISKGENNLRYR
jgi:hypothetical protein